MKVIEDVFHYGDLIKKVFPHALIERTSNYDDYYWGWSISPAIGVIMQFMVAMDQQFYINILIRKVTMNREEPLKVIFRGDVPAGDNGDPDLDFIEKVLVNYQCFSR